MGLLAAVTASLLLLAVTNWHAGPATGGSARPLSSMKFSLFGGEPPPPPPPPSKFSRFHNTFKRESIEQKPYSAPSMYMFQRGRKSAPKEVDTGLDPLDVPSTSKGFVSAFYDSLMETAPSHPRHPRQLPLRPQFPATATARKGQEDGFPPTSSKPGCGYTPAFEQVAGCSGCRWALVLELGLCTACAFHASAVTVRHSKCVRLSACTTILLLCL